MDFKIKHKKTSTSLYIMISTCLLSDLSVPESQSPCHSGVKKQRNSPKRSGRGKKEQKRTRPAIQSSSDHHHTLSHRPVQTNLTVSEMVDTQLHNFSLLCSSESFSISCTYISLSLPFNNQTRHLIRATEMLVEQIKRSLSESSYLLQENAS